MSEAYEIFAAEIYMTARQEIVEAAAGSGDLPVLIVSGYEHKDGSLENFLNYFTTDAEEEPAMASAYTHIAAIQASADLVGADNVVVSFEFDQQKLDERTEMVLRAIQTPSLSLEDVLKEEGLEERPVYFAMEYALEQGYEVVASDPWHRSPSMTDPKRFSGEIEALSQQATRYGDPPKVVVHIGGSSHFGTLQGQDLDDVLKRGSELLRDQAINPFEGIYGSTIFFNSYQPGSDNFLISFANEAAEYARNSANALQVNPPGQMDELDSTLISKRILTASAKMREESSPTGLDDIPLDQQIGPR